MRLHQAQYKISLLIAICLKIICNAVGPGEVIPFIFIGIIIMRRWKFHYLNSLAGSEMQLRQEMFIFSLGNHTNKTLGINRGSQSRGNRHLTHLKSGGSLCF